MGIPGGRSVEAQGIALQALHPDLRATLPSLYAVPTAVAVAVLELLPEAARAELVALGLARRRVTGTSGPAFTLTDAAFDLMRRADACQHADPQNVGKWLHRARAAAE